jgi:hypothetical protein
VYIDSDGYIKKFKEFFADHQLTTEQVFALGQPAAPGLTIFKLFRYIEMRMERLEKPTQDKINKLVAAGVAEAVAKQERLFNVRMEQVVSELEARWTERIKEARIR